MKSKNNAAWAHSRVVITSLSSPLCKLNFRHNLLRLIAKKNKRQAIKTKKETREKTQILWGKISSGGGWLCRANADVADEDGELTGTDNRLVTEAEKINEGWDVKTDPKIDWKSEVGEVRGCNYLRMCSHICLSELRRRSEWIQSENGNIKCSSWTSTPSPSTVTLPIKWHLTLIAARIHHTEPPTLINHGHNEALPYLEQ